MVDAKKTVAEAKDDNNELKVTVELHGRLTTHGLALNGAPPLHEVRWSQSGSPACGMTGAHRPVGRLSIEIQ